MEAAKKETPNMSERYKKSQELLLRAEKSIPLGAQTFSKSKTQFPHGVSPYFLDRGQGSHVFDVDDNEYIDFAGALGAITLGYCDPDVNKAVEAQLTKGTVFSLSTALETEVAEKIIDMVPCAEKVRFGKNGSDATAGAIRIARAFTNRDHVLVCGYHGWQDWYIGSTTRNKGVPKATRELTHTFPYDDLPALEAEFEKVERQVAAVIMEPMNVHKPDEGYLQAVKDLAHKHGALLIFDEVVTGFRFSKGGAQELLGVTPDLAAFGKGLANGFPLSAVAGRSDVMALMEEVFFSFTYGGEALSLAAASATLDKLRNEPVLETIQQRGSTLKDGIYNVIKKHDLQEVLEIAGHPSWSFLLMKDQPGTDSYMMLTLFLQEMHKRGILCLGTHMINYAHSEQDIQTLLKAYDEVLAQLKDGLNAGDLQPLLSCQPLKPLFKVR